MKISQQKPTKKQEPVAEKKSVRARPKATTSRKLKPSAMAHKYYDIDQEEMTFLDNIKWLDVDMLGFSSILDDIMQALDEDEELTKKLITDDEVESFKDVCWVLPHMTDLDSRYKFRVASEQQKLVGQEMEQPCSALNCNNNQFYCTVVQRSSPDEPSKSTRICTKCGHKETY